MKLHPIFKLREEASEGILQLLESVTLGTNGAHYRHLDTRQRILESDAPLFLSMERNEKVLGNITFCQRNEAWYIRYFAFDKALQSAGKHKTKSTKNNLLRTELNNFFDGVLTGNEGVESFYAYIDPRNEKSLWMSENFGFESVGKVATQTFSRTNPKPSSRVEKITDWSTIQEMVEKTFKTHQFYLDYHAKKPPFYILRDDSGEIVACTKITTANWEIKRLPGKMGGILTKLIPWIPGLRKLIRPKNHKFIVPEAVYVKDNNPELFHELFESILFQENLNLVIWWVDVLDPCYASMKEGVKWGLLNKLIGVAHANIVLRSKSGANIYDRERPIYTTGFDFI